MEGERGRKRGKIGRWQMFPETGAGESCYRCCFFADRVGDGRQPNRHRAPNDAQPLRHAGEKIAEIRGLIGGSIRYLSRVGQIVRGTLSLSLLDLYSIRYRVESFVTISSTAQLNGLDLSERLTSSFLHVPRGGSRASSEEQIPA